MITRQRFTRTAAAAALLVAGISSGSSALAQDAWPNRPITFIVPYAAGSNTDSFARLIAGEVAKRMGATIVVDNVNGAGGVLATDRVVHAKPDGYTYVIGVESTVLIAQMVRPSTVKYDGRKDLTPIVLMASSPLVLVARNDLPASTMPDLLNVVKTNPKAYSYGTSGIGTSLHLAGEMLNQEAKAELTHVPYSISTQILTDVSGGHLDMAMMPVGSVVPFVKSGKVKALAVTSSVRSPSLPEVPAMGETRTLRDVNMTVWFGLFGPAGIDKPIAAKLANEVRSVLGQANVKQRIGEMGMEPTPADGAAFAGFLTAENAKFKAIVDERRIKAE